MWHISAVVSDNCNAVRSPYIPSNRDLKFTPAHQKKCKNMYAIIHPANGERVTVSI